MRKKKIRLHFEEVEVLRAGSKGKAVGHAPDGRVILLSNAVPGDVVDVKTTKKRKAYFEGIVTKFHKLSEKRTEPVCQHFGTCGGCKWQHVEYAHQLKFKENEILENFRRIGKLQFAPLLPILASGKLYFYRNKLEFSFSDSRWLTKQEIESDKEIEDKVALGFHIPGMWDKVLDIEKCHLQEDPSNAIRLSIRDFAIRHGLSFFNPREQSGFLRTLMIRSSSTGDFMVLLQFFHDSEVERIQLLNHLCREFPQITSLLYVINSKPNDTIYDQEVVCYSGKDYITEEMEGLRFKVDAKSFYQTNSEQAYTLYKVVRQFAGLSGEEFVYDLYTGTGTIAQFIAGKAKKVVGIDVVPEAIGAAKSNALENGIGNVSFFAGDMKDIFNEQFVNDHGRPDVIITDPPREGMHKDVVKQIIASSAEKIVYVSCNSASQARDLALMKEDYRILKIQPVDMFPQTHHVENVVLLEKISSAL